LDVLADQLRQCAADRAHFYPGSHDACPWCRYTPPPARQPPPAPALPAEAPRPAPARPRLPRRSAYRAVTKRYRAATALAAAGLPARGGLLPAAARGSPPPPRAVHQSGQAGPRLLGGTGLGTEAVAFSPNGAMIATGDRNGHAYLWDAATGQRTAAPANFANRPAPPTPTPPPAPSAPTAGRPPAGATTPTPPP